MSHIKAVVFDIGQVLIEWRPEEFYDRILGQKDAHKAFFAQTEILSMNEQIDLGAPWQETVYALAEQQPNHAEHIHLWYDRWIEMASPAINWSAALLAALRKKHVPVLALSNFGTGPLALAQETYPYLNDFDQYYVSGHLGLIKPDPQIYVTVEENCGFAPDSLLFADDRPENIEAALDRGWHGHIFEHPKGWAERLVTEKLLTRKEALLES